MRSRVHGCVLGVAKMVDFAFFQFVFMLVPLPTWTKRYGTQGVQEVYRSDDLGVHALLVKINGNNQWKYGTELHFKFSPLLEAHEGRLPAVVTAANFQDVELAVRGQFPQDLREAILEQCPRCIRYATSLLDLIRFFW